MMERKNVVGYKPEFLELDKVEALDVDDELDFKIAEIMYKDLGIQTLLS
jgi:N-acylneuraminate cytidylyltransferase